jgi:hypothetical protein
MRLSTKFENVGFVRYTMLKHSYTTASVYGTVFTLRLWKYALSLYITKERKKHFKNVKKT